MQSLESISIRISVVVLIIIALLRVAKDADFHYQEKNLKKVEYDSPGYVLEISSKLPLYSEFAGLGRSYALIAIIEYSFFSSIGMIITDLDSVTPNSGNSIGPFLLLVILALWVIYPLLIFDEYHEIVIEGYRPQSLDFHLLMTLVLLSIQMVRREFDLTAGSAHPLIVVFSMTIIFTALSYKVVKFMKILSQERELT